MGPAGLEHLVDLGTAPVILPVIIGAVQLTTVAVGGETSVGLDRWLPLLAIFDALFLVICPWVFSVVTEE